jgi:hypothetical protein
MTPQELPVRVLKHYPKILSDWLQGLTFTPISFNIPKPNLDYLELSKHQKTWLEPPKFCRIEREKLQTRAHGTQTIAQKVWLDTLEDFLGLIDKKQEFANAQTDALLIRNELPALLDFLEQRPKVLIEHHQIWQGLLRVCQYFLTHPRPNQYARELPIAVHTKFIDENKGILRWLLERLLPADTIDWKSDTFEARFGLRSVESLIRFRILDSDLQTLMGISVSDISAPVSEFVALGWQNLQCLIVENKQTFLTLPALPKTIAIWGSGNAAQLLQHVTWLSNCQIRYWGDLDAHGFSILSRLRKHFPNTQSILMDRLTLEAFREFVVPSSLLTTTQLEYLNEQETQVFTELQRQNLRLEQEHLDHAFVLKRLLMTDELE